MLDREQIKARLAAIRLGSEVERFHSERTIQVETVGHHSFNVAWLALLMSPSADPVRRFGLVMAALSHDLAEAVVGDIPAPAKRAMNIRDKFHKAEKAYLQEAGLDYESFLTAEDIRVLKLADTMDGAFYCIGEASLGNRRVGTVFSNFRSYILELAPVNPIEMIILEYIDELWEKYGRATV